MDSTRKMGVNVNKEEEFISFLKRHTRHAHTVYIPWIKCQTTIF